MHTKAYLLAASILIAAASGCTTREVKAGGDVNVKVSTPDPVEKAPVLALAKTALPELTEIHSHSVNFNKRSSASIGKNLTLPKAAAVFCGTSRDFAGGAKKACLTRATKDGAWESLIIDLNNNKDLTDDAVLALPATGAERDVTIKHNGAEHTFVLKLQRSSEKFVNLSLSPTTGWQGGATIGEGTVKWVVADCNLNGKVDTADTAHLDIDGDGHFSKQRDFTTVVLRPQAAIYHDGKWYGVAADSAGTGLEVGPYADAMHTLAVDCSKIPGDKIALRELTVQYRDGKRAKLSGIDAAAGVKLPAGTLRNLSGTLSTSPKPLRFSVRNLAVTKDVTLVLGRPEARITVEHKGGKIHVSQKIVAPQGVKYTLARGKKGPSVEIFKSDDLTTPITTGNMKYG